MTSGGELGAATGGLKVRGFARELPPENLGDAGFQADYGVCLSYAAGSMANGIASETLVAALAERRILSSFGAAGLLPARIGEAIERLRAAVPGKPYAFNLIHNPAEEALESATVDLYVERGVSIVEASAFLELTPHVVRYRAAGLQQRADGSIERGNRLVAKVSRREVAAKFLRPAPPAMVADAVSRGAITEQQARMAEHVPMCDDLTVEADSGGHTDNRPLVALLPSLIDLRDEVQAGQRCDQMVRVGAAGGISTPAAALAALAMGAAYVVTGSVNQSCREAGVSVHAKRLLGQAGMADVMMAPAADMFEMGVRVQLLKRGTLFPMRAQHLYELYQDYDGLEALPEAERQRLENQFFRRSLDEIWLEVQRYFDARDPEQLRLATDNPKRKMALVFRWYLGLSSRWANSGEAGREMDYQIWCGPAIGVFNDWVRGSYLEAVESRSVVDVAGQIMHGAAYLHRIQALQLQGARLPAEALRYRPIPLDGVDSRVRNRELGDER
ncbi:MAG: PfaD family polyunsaturated fatty acid/polyketide biosynthesis protein [Chloroflexota bacterium]